MEILRTPDERFQNLAGYTFAPHYSETEGVRIHYVDEGPKEAKPVLMMHGEPSWAFLYRRMIPIFSAAGYRAVAPDLVGFGRSDKPAERADYTYQQGQPHTTIAGGGHFLQEDKGEELARVAVDFIKRST